MTDDTLLGLLPADLWRLVLRSLPLSALCELRCVNSAFHELSAPFLLHRLQLTSFTSSFFLYFPSSAPTHEIAINDNFLLVLHGHSLKCVPLPLPSHLPSGFFLRASGGGLLLFCDSRKQVRSPRLLVYNPILGCWKLLPRPPSKVAAHVVDISSIHGTLDYIVVVVNNTGWVAVYHSDTEHWVTVRLAHTYMKVKGLHNGSLYWLMEADFSDFDVIRVTRLSTRTYETSREVATDFNTYFIMSVGSGMDGAPLLIVGEVGEWIEIASRSQGADGKWSWRCGDDALHMKSGSRVAYAGGVLCNIPWVADSIPWMIDLKSNTEREVDQPFSTEPFCNVPGLNGMLPFQPSYTPVTHTSVDTVKKRKSVFVATMLSDAVNSIAIDCEPGMVMPL